MLCQNLREDKQNIVFATLCVLPKLISKFKTEADVIESAHISFKIIEALLKTLNSCDISAFKYSKIITNLSELTEIYPRF